MTIGLGNGIINGLRSVPIAALEGYITGIIFFLLFSILWNDTGPALSDGPRDLSPRWPRPLWLSPAWLLLSPLLLPRWLRQWATPAADSASATAADTIRADRRTLLIYATTNSLVIGAPLGGLVERQVLRQAGALYQFRHAAIKGHLVDGRFVNSASRFR